MLRIATLFVGLTVGLLTIAAQPAACQSLGPAAPCSPPYIDCVDRRCGPAPWDPSRPIAWQTYAQGEYVGHERTVHVGQYRLRVDDLMEFVYRLTREEITTPYELNVGDEIKVESFTDPNLNRDQLVVQPDGTITLRLLGQVRATRRTVPELRDELERQYAAFYKEPAITVTPTKVNARLEDLRSAVDGRYGAGGQTRNARVTPDGTIALPVVGNVFVQGLTLDEVKAELDARYAQKVLGIEVTPVLVARAPRTVYVLGEVRNPGRFSLEGPTTATQAIALAGGWNVGGDLKQVVVFRRGDDWRLLATKVDLWQALYTAKEPCPAGEIWLNDSDIVLVPKMGILQCDEWLDLIFTRGIYSVVPFQGVTINMAKLSSL